MSDSALAPGAAFIPKKGRQRLRQRIEILRELRVLRGELRFLG